MSADRTVVLLLLAALPCRALDAQTVAPRGRPGWLEAWSPLQARADLARALPRTEATAASLLLPAPRIGLFWTAGNPAGLRRELDDARTDFALGYDRETGDFRRPLDPDAARRWQASGMGWAPLDRRFALLGRVVLDQAHFDPGTPADVIEPYPTSPFVTADTSSAATRRTRAALEGAGSLQLGDWGVGLTLGYESVEQQTVLSGFVRRTRTALPGLIVGVSRRIGLITAGAHGRWRGRTETISLFERAAHGLVIQLEGLREVTLLEIPVFYYRRIEEEVPSAGFTLAGPLGGGHWLLFAERSWLRERLTRQQQENPDEDTWDAAAWSAGAAYQRRLGGRALLSFDARYTTLSGTGDLALDTVGVIFRAAERSLVGSAELRIPPDSVGWGLVLGGQLRYERRSRDDLTLPIGSQVTGLTTGASVEVGRAVSPEVLVSLTVACAGYSADSRFPAGSVYGPVYRTYVLPEFDLAARTSRPLLGALAVRWAASGRTALWAVLRGERVAPTDHVGPTPFLTSGSRSAVSASAGVTLR